ncbi:hypothetical protein [Iodidimonas sp. MBR-14]|uniref:hypothetical protein n=1 Tax=Iodidimonas sp. MBR-14 TaxID=3032319 RepID=UPI0024829C8F|nr:hypothetical protein [Iodidimonas sp. MBR-14]
MKTLNKLALSGAMVALMAGAAHADVELTVGNTGTIGNMGTPINLAAGSNFLQQSGTVNLFVGEGADAGFGLGANPATLTFRLSGTGFVLNGTPAVNIRGGCNGTVIAADVTGGVGDASFTVAVNGDFEDNCGDAGNELSLDVPVILTNTTLGNSASASVSLAATAAPTVVVASDALDDPIVEVVEPFELTIAAATNVPKLSLIADPTFSAFVASTTTTPSAAVGTVNLSQTGGTVVTAIAAKTPLANPDSVTLSVTVEDSTGIDNISLNNPAVNLVNSTTTPNVFSVELTGANVNTFVGGAKNLTVNLLTADDAAMVSAQALTLAVASLDGSDASIATASGSGSLASLERDGTSRSFDWVAFEPANLNNIFRFTGLDADAQVFATLTNLNSVDANDSNRVNDFDVTAAGLTTGVTAGGELQISAVALGDAMADAGVLDPDAVSITRGSVTFTVEQLGVRINRLMFNADGAVNSTTDWNQSDSEG